MDILERLKGIVHSLEDVGARDEQRVSAGRDATRMCDVEVRRRVRVCGVIRAVTYPAPGAGGSFKATLWDGTGTLDVIWLGQADVEGIHPGLHLVAEGVAARRADAICLYNPTYEVIA